MANLIATGKLKAQIAKGFAGKLCLGRMQRTSAAGLDDFGDPATPTVASFTFEGIRENFSQAYIARTGIPATDVGVLVLLGSCRPAFTPKQEDLLFVGAPFNKWHKVRQVIEIDPAGASARCQCYEVPAP